MRPLRALIDLLFPTRAICVCCGSKAGLEREWVCEPCRRMLARNWIGAFTEHRMDGMAVAYRRNDGERHAARLRADSADGRGGRLRGADAQKAAAQARLQPVGAARAANRKGAEFAV